MKPDYGHLAGAAATSEPETVNEAILRAAVTLSLTKVPRVHVAFLLDFTAVFSL